MTQQLGRRNVTASFSIPKELFTALEDQRQHQGYESRSHFYTRLLKEGSKK